MAYCACADPGQVKQTGKMKIGAVGGMDIEEGIQRRATSRGNIPVLSAAMIIIAIG